MNVSVPLNSLHAHDSGPSQVVTPVCNSLAVQMHTFPGCVVNFQQIFLFSLSQKCTMCFPDSHPALQKVNIMHPVHRGLSSPNILTWQRLANSLPQPILHCCRLHTHILGYTTPSVFATMLPPLRPIHGLRGHFHIYNLGKPAISQD